jgi:hypothetical protein
VAARRDDIVTEQRVQIAIEMMSPQRSRGTVEQLAQTHRVSRQALYQVASKGRRVLQQEMGAGRHGPQAREQTIWVDKNRLRRGVATLTENEVSQRGVVTCLAELLDTSVSVGWVNGELARLEQAAIQVNESWTAGGTESLSGDELFSNGRPNLLVVGNESLYIYVLSRQDERDGDTWGCLLLGLPAEVPFASDAGTGLAAGAQAAGMRQHQLDWDHLLRPLWGQATRLEKQAYAAIADVEERAAQFEQAHTPKRLQQHLTKWEELVEKAEEKMAQVDTFNHIARQVDDHFALIHLESGVLPDATVASRHLRALGEQLSHLSGRIYQKLATNLQNWASDLFSYQFALRQALVPVQREYGQDAIAALSRIWQCEADQKRRRLSLPEQQQRQQIWQQALDEAYALLGDTRLWSAWDALVAVLERSWRGSMLAECINSLLRPLLDRRKHTDQGCLELFRFFHNVRPFQRGKRAGQSPAELVGISLPDDPLSLLGLAPKVSS